MSVVWQVRLKNAVGKYVAVVDDWWGFSIAPYVNGLGAWAVQVNAEDPVVEQFDLDGQVEFWWRDNARGIGWSLEHEGVVRNMAYYLDSQGGLVAEISGRGYNDLLVRRIIEAAAGSSGGTKSGVAETIIKAWVTAQAGSGAGARAITGLSVEADGATGDTVPMAAAYDLLYETCRAIATVGGGDFAVVGTGAAAYEFKWYEGQLGDDKTDSVVFALGNGNMASPKLTVSRADEVNAVLVAGQGEAEKRETVWRTDAPRIAESGINRREKFQDARQESSTAGLNALGDIALKAGEPKRSLQFQIQQTVGSAYGIHYGLGDLVSAEFMGDRVTKKIMGVTITVNARGESRKVSTADV